MVRQTSIEAYHKIKNEGLLSKRRFQIYESLFLADKPLTATQIANRLECSKSPSVGINVHARLGELRSLGVICECSLTKCPITKQTVILWDVTNKLPVKPNKKITHSRKHLENCREVLIEVYSHPDLPMDIKYLIAKKTVQ